MGDIYQREVDRLAEHTEGVQEELKKDRTKRKADYKKRRAQEAYIKLPYEAKHEFFCTACDEDFVAPAWKVWNDRHGMGFWRSFCYNCESPVVRYITHKNLDPYYHLSKKVRLMQSTYAKDIIQPGQYGFKLLYGDPYEWWYKKMQKKNEDIDKRYGQFGLAGKTVAQIDAEEEAEEELRSIYG